MLFHLENWPAQREREEGQDIKGRGYEGARERGRYGGKIIRGSSTGNKGG